MANYQLLKADIDAKVYENAYREITGENLNYVLNAMVTTLGAGYQFAGVATKDTNPEVSDAKVFYIANGKGTYTNFGGINVTEDDVVVLYWDTAWHKVSTGIASQAKLSELESKIEGIPLVNYSNTISSNTFVNIEPSTQEREVTVSLVADNSSALTRIVFLKGWSPLQYIQGSQIDYQYNGYRTIIPAECDKIGLYPNATINLELQLLLGAEIPANINKLNKDVDSIKESLTLLDARVDKCDITTIHKDLFVVENKYINHSGTISSSEGLCCTDFLPYIPTEIKFKDLRYNANYISAIAFYDNNKSFIKALYDFDESSEHTVQLVQLEDIPSNAAYIRMSSSMTFEPEVSLYSFSKVVEEVNSLRYIGFVPPSKNGMIKADSASLNNGENMSMYVPNIKNGKNISFCADVQAFESIDIRYGNDYAYYRKGSIRIDSNDLIVYSPNSVQDVELVRVAHGLTVSSFLYVQIKGDVGGLATISISSSDGVFIKELSKGSFYGCVGDIVVSSNGSTLSNCILCYGSPDLQEETWVYGDSYLDYWTVPAIDAGHNHFLNDGHSGRRTEEALVSFKKELEMHTPPKRVLWCMGMNNFDTDTEINAAYKSATDEMISICDSLGIEVILCTIPNCWNYNTQGSSVRHTFKNQYIKDSGKRYVDVAHALGADRGVDVDWFEGLRQANDIHPSSLGAKILMQYIVSQVPEL